MDPKEYFDILKENKKSIDEQDLSNFYDNCLELLNKYKATGQTKAAKKLIFLLETVEKEREVVRLGIDTFVHYDDIENYIDNISKEVVKIIELKNYERDIPNDIVKTIEAVGGKFDQLYVVFTDYTGKAQRTVEKERREKDPILFGTFQNNRDKSLLDRFYFLGDWEDEYCDLTLGKMAFETKSKINKDIVQTISSPDDIQELKEQIEAIEQGEKQSSEKKPVKLGFLLKLKHFFIGV